MPEPRPDFAFPLSLDVVARIRATAPRGDLPRRLRLPLHVRRLDERPLAD